MKSLQFSPIVCLILFPLLLTAQPHYRAKLQQVKQDGFYAIDLPVEIIGNAKADFSDLRIITTEGVEVPYIIKKDASSTICNEFIPYPVMPQPQSNRATCIEIQTEGEKVASFVLNIKNTDTRKKASLKGSNDHHNWFSVKEDLNLSEIYNDQATHTYYKIEFPLSDYNYYQLSVNDSLAAPINILGIGKIDRQLLVKRNRLEIPSDSISIVNENEYTVITITYPGQYQISDLLFYISGPQFYNREIYIYNPTSKGKPQVSGRKKKLEVFPEYQYYTLNSEDKDTRSIRYNYYTGKIKIGISNGNNPPLTIDSIRTYTDKFYLVTQLQDSIAYSLTYGDVHAIRPDYDLSFFADKIPVQLEHLKIGIPENQYQETTKDSMFMTFVKKYGIWTIIVLVIFQILYIVRKITRR